MEEGASPPRMCLGQEAWIGCFNGGKAREKGGHDIEGIKKGREVELWSVSHKTFIHQSYNKCYTCFYL